MLHRCAIAGIVLDRESNAPNRRVVVTLSTVEAQPQDAAAWGEFVDLYAPVVYGFGCKQGLQDADAADLTQEVLSKVAGAAGRFQYDPTRGSFRAPPSPAA